MKKEVMYEVWYLDPFNHKKISVGGVSNEALPSILYNIRCLVGDENFEVTIKIKQGE